MDPEAGFVMCALFVFNDAADADDAVDLLQPFHCVMGHGMTEIQQGVGVIAAALIGQVFDVQPLVAEEVGDLAEHVRDVPVQDGNAGCRSRG